ncbi:MAG: RNA polymerase sigma factor [Pseudomonadota bacterium]
MALDAMSEVSDDALLARYAHGDREAARSLTLRLAPRILGHAFRLLGDRAEAEDVTQEALLRLWRIAPDWRPGEAKVTTWLYRVTANLCTDRLRRTRHALLDEVPEIADGSPAADQTLLAKSRAAALQVALAALPARQREAVSLRHIEGLGNPEIAEIMDISVEAVESLTARGKRALAKTLAARRADLGFEP